MLTYVLHNRQSEVQYGTALKASATLHMVNDESVPSPPSRRVPQCLVETLVFGVDYFRHSTVQ